MDSATKPGQDKFALPLLEWFAQHGRTTLPWQRNRDPYLIWVSEIMLQQTQVETVVPYFEKFIAKFPEILTLANAHLDEVMSLWAGLGYYARARNLHRAAQQIRDDHANRFPETLEETMALPGIGRSTAGAILAFSTNQRHPILDGNVKRVLARYFAIPGYPGDKSVLDRLWQAAETLTPYSHIADYTQAIMDLGSQVCTRRQPACHQCPVATNCSAKLQGKTEDYPGRKPRSTRRKKQSTMLLVTNSAGEYLMLKRPPSGIWGGLWALPEIPNHDADHQRWCRQELAISVGPGKKLKKVSHTFTHFDLEMLPLQCVLVDHADVVMDDKEQLWYNLREPGDVAIPTAMKKIFNQIAEELK